MLLRYPGADGMKTGYIEMSGHNLVTSAVRGDVRLIGVVMGASNGYERDTHMAALLDAGFDRMGVPVSREPARERWRVPALVAAALPPSGAMPRVHYAGARGYVVRPAARVSVVERRVEVYAHRRTEPPVPPIVHAHARPEHLDHVSTHGLVHSSAYRSSAAASLHVHG
jgi:D-alanyl-D-alanine carboxypeptidase